MTDTTSEDYRRGVDDALAEVGRRVTVADKQGEFTSRDSVLKMLDETAQRLHGRQPEADS